MSCVDEMRLFAYWLGELEEPDEQALEEHVFECASCEVRCEAISQLLAAVRGRLPPTLSPRAMAVLDARGVRLRPTVIQPGERATVVFGRDVDLLVHRLQADLAGVARLDVELYNAADGAPLMAIPGLPFEAAAGEVNLVCQRHYVQMFPPDAGIRLVAVDGEERRVVGVYGVMHVVE